MSGLFCDACKFGFIGEINIGTFLSLSREKY